MISSAFYVNWQKFEVLPAISIGFGLYYEDGTYFEDDCGITFAWLFFEYQITISNDENE